MLGHFQPITFNSRLLHKRRQMQAIESALHLMAHTNP